MRHLEELFNETAVAILCAGQSTRMKASDLHKVCFPVQGVPAILRTLRMFHHLGARRIVLVVGALAETVMRAVGREFPRLSYAYQHEPLGTGHAAQVAAGALKALGHGGPTLITMGDKVIEPHVIRELAERFALGGADLAFVTGPKAENPAFSESGRVVLDKSGAILGVVETRDLQRARILESLATLARRRPKTPISRAQILELGRLHIRDVEKLEKALRPAAGTILTAGKATGAELLKSLGPRPGRIRLAGRAMTPGQIERQSGTVNLSVYLGAAEFWERVLPRLSNDNAQREYYLTDVVGLAAEDPRGWKLAQHPIGDPADVMAFNSMDELRGVEEALRRKAAAQQAIAARSRAVEAPGLPANMLRPAGKWLELFERWPPALDRLFAGIYGAQAGGGRREVFVRALQAFVERYGARREAIVVRAPGRINLMGRHIDHRGGAVNVMAIDRDVVFVAAQRQDDAVTLRSADSRQFADREFRVRELLGEAAWDDWLAYVNSAQVRTLLARAPGDWSHYVMAPLLRLQQRFGGLRIRGFDAAVAGDIPMAAGLSSSSALVVAAAEAAVAFNGLDIAPAQLVDLCGEGEWFVGSRGGAADHAAIRLARRGQLAHIHFLPFRLGEVCDFPQQCCLIIARSGIDAHKSAAARSRFNQKVASYELGLMLLKQRLPQYEHRLEHVRDLNPRRLNCPLSEIYRALLRVPQFMEAGRLRQALAARHGERLEAIFSSHEPPKRYDLRGVLLYGAAECERSLMAPGLLGRGEVERFGRLMRISHDGDRIVHWRRLANGVWRSLKFRCDCSDRALRRLCDDLAGEDPRRLQAAQLHRQPGAYGCSLPPIDKMVDLAGAIPGVYGAQLGGAGLGGCIMILARPEAIETVRETLARQYYEPSRIEPLIHVCNPVSGAGALKV